MQSIGFVEIQGRANIDCIRVVSRRAGEFVGYAPQAVIANLLAKEMRAPRLWGWALSVLAPGQSKMKSAADSF